MNLRGYMNKKIYICVSKDTLNVNLGYLYLVIYNAILEEFNNKIISLIILY